ncbi:MAG: GNAT family N-acetyltransferase [Clostridiaceae bacterium]|nr:GNAT family N-acetyltransferase [Clostridiaceae bacterium]
MKYTEKTIKLKDGTECILRSPEINDAKDMIEYMRMTSGETHFMVRYPEEIKLTEDKEKELIKETLNSNNDMMIAAFVGGILAGNAGVNCYRNHIKIKHRAVFGISIKEEFWNLGIGNILVEESIKEARKMGFDQIELTVFSDNIKAQNLYKKHGFEVCGTVKNGYRLKDGSYRDEIMMQKMLTN